MKVLVTGAAGFIGFYLARKLLDAGHYVVGLDNLNDYYDVSLKQARLDELTPYPAFRFVRLDLADRQGMAALFASEGFDQVAHMAAQAGVRYSLENPHAYVDSNLVGFVNILEGCRHHAVKHLVYASSSSVYGENGKTPFAETDNVDHPVSLYAATKKSNELMADTYSHLYRFPATGLRFFTVYGPWGRPDMALFKFVRAILAGEPIDVYNHGDMARDFTYVDDIVEGVVRVMGVPLAASEGPAPHRIFNIGRGQPVQLADFIAAIEQVTGRSAVRNMMPMQPGDVPVTWADTSALLAATGYRPQVALADGVRRFVDWYRRYYRV
ncbi:MAG: NAD-dependent epimerase [Alcanivoracaceae bacterium]|nr:NAD-dependent epimerase [Alcanivoracaceae bacterium]